MSSPIASILRAATRLSDEPLNVLTCCTHESYETCLAKTGHRFWAVRTKEVKNWNSDYRPLPSNYVLLNPHRGDRQLPVEVDFDVAFSQNKFGQFRILKHLSHQLHLPLISLEHTLPVPNWPANRLSQLKSMRGHINVFISEFSREKWGWNKDEAEVIHHGIDTELFSPLEGPKKKHFLSVCNDWINRDWCCGFKLWREVTQGLPVFPVGATPGLSRPAKDTNELVRFYREAQVFLNTSLISPVPTALLEAMACGCAVVTTATAMIPEVVENGVNGFISNEPKELRSYCERLLADAPLARRLGEAARETILKKFSLGDFVANWDALLRRAANITYTGI